MNEDLDTVKPSLKLLLWLMISFSNVIFIGMIFFLQKKVELEEFNNAPFSSILFFMGIIMLIMSFVLPKHMKPSDSVENADISKYILSLALNEATSIFGFVIAYINSDMPMGLTLIGVSIVGFVIKFPKADVSEKSLGSNSLNID
jgi:cytochrome bd-type quinol oxidase subunit 2